jgi:signal transduction histidine kinase
MGEWLLWKGKEIPMRRGAKPARAKGESKGPVAGKSGKGEGLRVGDLEKRLAEALEREAGAVKRETEALGQLQTRNRELVESREQQTATSEILRVIASSPTGVQRVFDAIVTNAASLCEASQTAVLLARDGLLHLDALHHTWMTAEGLEEFRRLFPTPITPAVARTLQGETFHIADITRNPAATEGMKTLARHGGYESMVWVPLMRGDEGLGLLGVTRATPRPFDENQIAVLRNFADQAVIAIENVRLFGELQARNAELAESLDQQTTTADILRIISTSPTDLQPVLDTVVESAARLCGSYDAMIAQMDGTTFGVTAHFGPLQTPASVAKPDPRSVVGRAFLFGQKFHVADLQAAAEEFPLGHTYARDLGFHTQLSIPLLREGTAIGVLTLRRADVAPFTDAQIALLQTFADQAVIAIENVRLFKELEAANRELAAASRHKSEFLANMSHELRTPLNAILGFSEVLAERMFGDLNEKQEEYLKDIHASGNHLLSLINDILDLSKIEAGRMELELSEFDLPTAIDNALTLVRERASRRSITLRMTVDERVGQVQGDARKIRQVLLNLLSNAIKFTPEGGRIGVEARSVDGFVEVSVSDTGVGIAPEDQEAVFEEFRQVGTADKKVEGTGLGLALSRKFIELHRGRIWLESQVGVGSTFTFSIPVLRAGQVIE